MRLLIFILLSFFGSDLLSQGTPVSTLQRTDSSGMILTVKNDSLSDGTHVPVWKHIDSLGITPDITTDVTILSNTSSNQIQETINVGVGSEGDSDSVLKGLSVLKSLYFGNGFILDMFQGTAKSGVEFRAGYGITQSTSSELEGSVAHTTVDTNVIATKYYVDNNSGGADTLYTNGGEMLINGDTIPAIWGDAPNSWLGRTAYYNGPVVLGDSTEASNSLFYDMQINDVNGAGYTIIDASKLDGDTGSEYAQVSASSDFGHISLKSYGSPSLISFFGDNMANKSEIYSYTPIYINNAIKLKQMYLFEELYDSAGNLGDTTKVLGATADGYIEWQDQQGYQTLSVDADSLYISEGNAIPLDDIGGGIATETDPIYMAWDKDYEDLTNTPTIESLNYWNKINANTLEYNGNVNMAGSGFGVNIGGGAELRKFNIYGSGLDGRISIQGASRSDYPGIELTNNANSSRVLVRLQPIGTDGNSLQIFTEPSGGVLTNYWTFASDGNLNFNISRRITGLANPINDQDAATKSYVDLITTADPYANSVLVSGNATGGNGTYTKINLTSIKFENDIDADTADEGIEVDSDGYYEVSVSSDESYEHDFYIKATGAGSYTPINGTSKNGGSNYIELLAADTYEVFFDQGTLMSQLITATIYITKIGE